MKIYIVTKTSYEVCGDDVYFEILKVFSDEKKATEFIKSEKTNAVDDEDYNFYIDYIEKEIE